MPRSRTVRADGLPVRSAVANLPEPYREIIALAVSAIVLAGIGGVFFWLRSVTRDDTALPRRTFFRRRH
jgi:hypothetical protein